MKAWDYLGTANQVIRMANMILLYLKQSEQLAPPGQYKTII